MNKDKLQKILGEMCAEIYRLKHWKEDVGDNPDTVEEKWFDQICDKIDEIY